MKSTLEVLVGRTAARLLLYLVHHGEAYASGAARDLGITLSATQRQLEKLEETGLLVSKMSGRTRVYTFNPKGPATERVIDLVTLFLDSMTMAEREDMFSTRRRPRRRGKPVRR